MVTATDIKLLPYFNGNLPVRPRFQGSGSKVHPVPPRAFGKSHALHQYTPNPIRMENNSHKDNNALHTYNTKRRVELRAIHPAGRLVDTYA